MGAVFVTGGSGLLGREITRRLVADGREVVALARSEASARLLRDLGAANVVRGDVLDRDALVDGMAGCDTVYHVAGVNGFCFADPAPMFLVNIEGSRRVVRAAASAGVQRVVYTSSAAALGEPDGAVGDEDTRHRGSYLSNYEKSKHLAEEAVRQTAEAEDVDVVHVLPSSVQGPGRSGGTGKLLIDFVNGKLKAVPDTRLSIVDIDDCTQGHVLAEEHGKAGERYVLSGPSVTIGEGLRVLGEVTGVSYKVRTLPGPAAMAAATGMQLVGRVRGKKPKFCREMVRTMLHGHAYDGSKATRDLGLTYTPIEDTLRRTVAWFVEQGLVDRALPGLDGN
jgi:dihydroflavonol-4-reductase